MKGGGGAAAIQDERKPAMMAGDKGLLTVRGYDMKNVLVGVWQCAS